MIQIKSFNKILATLLLVSIFTIFSTIFVAAAPGGANITLEINQGSFPLPNPGAVNVTAGNITLLNLSSTQQTFRWVGLYGNVSGEIKLGNSQSNVLYSWTAIGKYVYASTASSISWTTINISNLTGILAEYPYLDNGSDNYTLTFDTTGTIDSEILGLITGVPAAITYNSTGSPTWPTYSLMDGTSVLFATQVNASGDNSFSNENVNYQMIIPENGLGQNTLPTEYYLWVELV